MQVHARSCSCAAIVLMGLTAPAVAQDKSAAPAVPTVAVPKIMVVPDPAARAVVPTVAPAVLQRTSNAASNAIAGPVIATTPVTPAVAAKPMDAPRIDLMPRTVVTSQPGIPSRLDVLATHEATKALTTKAEVKGEVTAGRVGATADAGGDTRLAANSTHAVTDAVAAAESAPSQARPIPAPDCR